MTETLQAVFERILKLDKNEQEANAQYLNQLLNEEGSPYFPLCTEEEYQRLKPTPELEEQFKNEIGL